MAREEKKDFKQLVRIANTDLNGEKRIGVTLRRIKGIGFVFGNAILATTNIDPKTKGVDLTESQIKDIESALKDPKKYNLPSWLFNRRKDYEDGQDKHLIQADLEFARENDIRHLKKIKAYRGIRHILGLPTRGQRTKSNFRKNKGKGSLGVKKGPSTKTGSP